MALARYTSHVSCAAIAAVAFAALAAPAFAAPNITGSEANAVNLLSPFLTCEEAFLLARYLKGLNRQVRLALGPVPVVGQDDTYPKDRHGRPVQPVKFTIRAEKWPNRRGVEEVLRHFQGELIKADDIYWAAGEGKLQAVYLAAGYPPRPGGWISEEQSIGLKRVPLLVVQDLFPSPASALAKYVLPAATFASHSAIPASNDIPICTRWNSG